MEDGLDVLIAELWSLKGKAFWQRLITISQRKEFKESEKGIYTAGNTNNPDYDNLMNAARKAKAFGFTVYILPNPKTVSSADFIFKYRNSYKLYELKTIQGKNSVGNRLRSSVLQSDRVVLNFTVSYNIRRLADEINRYYETFPNVKEVLMFYRKRRISVRRVDIGHTLWKRLMKKLK